MIQAARLRALSSTTGPFLSTLAPPGVGGSRDSTQDQILRTSSQTLTVVLVNDRQNPERSAVLHPIHGKVAGPDMVPVLGPELGPKGTLRSFHGATDL